MDLDRFAVVVEAAMGDYADVILVAQSLGGFTAPKVRTPVQMMVLLNATIPSPPNRPTTGGAILRSWWQPST